MNRVVWTPQTYLTIFDVPVHRNTHCQYHRTHRTGHRIPPTESRALQGEWQPDSAAFPAHGAGRKCGWRFFRESEAWLKSEPEWKHCRFSNHPLSASRNTTSLISSQLYSTLISPHPTSSHSAHALVRTKTIQA